MNVPETRRRIETLIEYLKSKKFDSLNEAEKVLVQELDGYQRNIAVYEKSFKYIDTELQAMKDQIGAIFDKFIEYQKTPEIPSCEMNLQEEISFIAGKLSTKPGENPLDKALWIQPAVALLEKVKEDNEEVGRLANNLSLIYKNLGDYQNALIYSKKALDIGERILMYDDPNLSSAYNNVALIYKNLGDYQNALVFAKKDLEISERTLQPDHPSLTTSYNSVAMIYKDLGDYQNALVFAKKSFDIRERTLQPDHPSLATSYNNLSTIYQGMGDYSNALVFAEKAIEICERTLQPDHPLLATSYHTIALIYQDMTDLKLALHYAEKAHEIVKKKLPDNHPHVKSARDHVEYLQKLPEDTNPINS